MSHRIATLAAFAILPVLAQAPPARTPSPNDSLVSPEVAADRTVTFRLYAPHAEKVVLQSEFKVSNPVAFTKAENGVWTATTGPVDAGTFRYTFTVDGVRTIDPKNPATSESQTNAHSVLVIPGADFMDATDVPHGAVAAVYYKSTALNGRMRRMHIYTPPGYEMAGGSNKYPVFYLLHGASDCDDSWTSVGRANFIFDNLIAARKAKPMIVVMPAGHTSVSRYAPGAADEFLNDFISDIVPYVEKNYRVMTARKDTAIAGLSMGGSQTLNLMARMPEKFAYVGVFSSGVIVRPAAPGQTTEAIAGWAQEHSAKLDGAGAKKGMKLLWFSTGSDDFLLNTTKATVDTLTKHGYEPVFKESTGGHTWVNWREYLNVFTPALFQ